VPGRQFNSGAGLRPRPPPAAGPVVVPGAVGHAHGHERPVNEGRDVETQRHQDRQEEMSQADQVIPAPVKPADDKERQPVDHCPYFAGRFGIHGGHVSSFASRAWNTQLMS
jgi:hypothetical protein